MRGIGVSFLCLGGSRMKLRADWGFGGQLFLKSRMNLNMVSLSLGFE